MKLVLSGIQPTGVIHIGNYLGALKTWVELSKNYKSIFFVADLHALTTFYDKNLLSKLTEDLVISYIAAGIDPNKSIIFIQSAVKEHAELAWLFNCITPLGDLYRMTQFKDKSQKQTQENLFAGLLNYPVLMAADILLYNPDFVPVGEDQLQHLELTRRTARRFNHRFGVELFKEVEPIISKAKRVIGLDGKKKMSKSENNYVSLSETKEEIWQKLRKAYTDPTRLRKSDPGHPEECNLFKWHEFFSDPDTVKEIKEECKKGTIGCVQCKKKLLESMEKEIAPIREKIFELRKNIDYIRDIIEDGNNKASIIAQEQMYKIKKAMGLFDCYKSMDFLSINNGGVDGDQ